MSHPLDESSFVLRRDPKGMYRYTCDFPAQCRQAHQIALEASLTNWSAKPDCVVLTGLGGSASGGDFTRALFEEGSTIPFFVNRDYSLPRCVGNGSLVFATSYSGNTEETLSAYAGAKGSGASIICVTSGGKLADLARADGYPLIVIPGGQPPRTALGFMLVPVLVACQKLKLIPEINFEALFAHLESCVKAHEVAVPFQENPTKQLAQELHGKLGVLYGLGSWQSIVAYRWKCQINENAKAMISTHAYPELCHNEILGWVNANRQGVDQWLTVVLSDGTESAKMRKRAEVVARLTQDRTRSVTVEANGSTLIEKMLGLALYGDFVSLYLAALNDIDPENIDAINILKSELAKVT